VPGVPEVPGVEGCPGAPDWANAPVLIAKAHPMAKSLVVGQLDKAKPLARSTRRAQLDISVYSDSELREDGAPSPGGHMDESLQRLYTPQQKTYTLADFIREKRTSTRSQRTRHDVPIDSFVQVEMPDVPSVDEAELQVVPSTQSSPLLANATPKGGVFKALHLRGSTVGIASRDDFPGEDPWE